MSQRPRSPNGVNLHRFLQEYGVTVKPYHEARAPRPRNTVYGGRTISRLMRKDIEQCRTVILCIQASNAACFEEGMIWSIWCFVHAHMAHRPRHEVVSMFRGIDIAEINRRAHRLVTGECARMGKTAEKISTLLADRLLERET